MNTYIFSGGGGGGGRGGGGGETAFLGAIKDKLPFFGRQISVAQTREIKFRSLQFSII